MAGTRFLENLCKQSDKLYDIQVFGSEPHAGYNRILLSPLLSGEQTLNDIITHSLDWYEKNNIDFNCGKTIIEIDRINKQVKDSEGKQYKYDKLILATGSEPFIPPIPGRELKGIYSYRTIEDVNAMMMFAETKTKAVVIGGGLLGLEAAYGLQKRGMDVTVLHLQSVLMENQLDETASESLISSLTTKGLTIKTKASTQQFNGEGHVESVQLTDDTIIPAHLVVIAVGIRPNISLGKKTGLDCDRGILVNDHLQTSDADIFALGECVQHQGKTYGLVGPLYEQAATCADYLSGNLSAQYTGSVTATGLKVTGIDLFSAGQFLEDNECKVIKLLDRKMNIYRKLIIKDKTLVGALLYGDISGSLWYQQLIQLQTDISPYKEFIMFGPDYLPEETHQDEALVAA